MTEIPQEAIEAAAVVIASQFDTGPMPVDDTDRQYATEVLEAALPFLRSQWERELVRWLRSDDWDDDDIWAFYADAIARSIETRRVAFGEAT